MQLYFLLIKWRPPVLATGASHRLAATGCQPVAEVQAYLHVQISPISCNVVGSILHMCLEKTLTHKL